MGLKKHPDLTEEQKLKVVELWKLGYGSPTIGLRMKMASGPIYKYLTENGFSRRKTEMLTVRKENKIHFSDAKKRFPDLDEKQKVEAVRMFNEGYGPTSIARTMSLHYSSVERHLRELGLKRTMKEAHNVRPCYQVIKTL